MRITLSKVFAIPALALAAGLLVSSAGAVESVTIPFDFTAMGQCYPAGTYSVEQKPAQHMVTLHQLKGTASFNWLVGPGAQGSESNVLLNFRRSGDKQELKSIQFGRRFTLGGQPFTTPVAPSAPARP